MSSNNNPVNYGIGLKMLKKMGYKEGEALGKEDNKGIIKPLEGVMRPKSVGLGFADNDAMEEHAPKKKKSRDHDTITHEADQYEQERFKKGYKKSKDRYFDQDKSNRSNQMEQDNVVSGSFDDIMMQTRTGSLSEPKSFSVMDASGPQRITLVNVRDILSMPQQYSSIDPTKRFAELHHNAQLIVLMSEKALKEQAKKISLQKASISQLEEDAKVVALQANMEHEILDRHQNVYACLHEMMRLLNSQSSYEQVMAPLTSSMQLLYSLVVLESDEFFKQLIHQYLISLLVPFFKRQFSLWIPLKSPSLFIETFEFLKSLQSTSAQLSTKSSSRKSKLSVFEILIYSLWLPRIRATLNHPDWDIYTPELLVAILKNWWEIIPLFVQEEIIADLLLPKLVKALQAWNPSLESEPPLHVWLIPWIPLIPSVKQPDLFNQLTSKLHLKLRNWHPSSSMALDIVTPWKNVMDPTTLQTFLSRSILPQLTQLLRNEFTIDPKNQQLEPLEWVFAWIDVLPLSQFIGLLEKDLFSKWMSVLYLWLTSHPDYDQIVQWYLGWKSLFPEELVHHPALQLCFRRGLDIMNGLLDNPSLPLEHFFE